MRSAWRGEYPLSVSFWGLYVFGFFAAAIVGGVIVFACRQLGMLGVGWAIGGAAWLSWLVFSTIAVWKSAVLKVRSPIWLDRMYAYGALLLVFLTSGRMLLGLIGGGALRWVNLVAGAMDLNP
jgi:hypothetical protein